MKREVLLAEARKRVWAGWQDSAEELASQAVATLHGLGMLVPEGGAAELEELRARPAELAPLREAALHDLPPGTQWRVIATDSESLTGLAPVCTADRRFHEIPDYPGGPKYDDEGVYDCCPWPQIETYSVDVAAYLVALLNADAEPQPDSP
ncbi:hypothetical protein [Streptomyces sp. ECR3.8]|uniref:hypothetical protein n=1 Tax=Streptomyces sp. ECR3.8 TaxID=3461009 RepID=UPI00404174A7